MKKENTIIFFLFLKIFFLISFNLNAQIQNKILANIGNQIISSYELKNKVITVLILRNQSVNQENINLVKNQAMRNLVNYKLKKQQVQKFKISSNTTEVDSHLKKVSSRFSTDLNGLRELFKVNNISFDLYLDEVKTEFAWKNLIMSIYKDKVKVINEAEVERELKLQIKNNEDLVEYKLSEIEILSKDEAEIKKIESKIKEIGFKETAINFSDSSSSFDGGNLGWVTSKELSKNILQVVSSLKVGDISKPINLVDRILILKLLDKKKLKIDEKNIQILRSKIINKKRNDILNLYSNSHLSKLKNNAFIKMK